MQRILSLTTLVSIVLISLGQNVPNGDFESWGKRDHYKLDSWYSYNNTVYRTTDAKVGTYAIRLNNEYRETSNGLRGYATNYRSNDKANFGGAAFNGEPLSLVFWSKHDLAKGDTARIYVDFREKGNYKGRVDFRIAGSTNGDFVKYRVPIQWSGARSPDSVRVTLYSKVRTKIQGDGYIIYDDIHFENIGRRSPDIVNSDFENWGNVGIDYPKNWKSIDLRYYDDYRNFYTRKSVYKSSDDEAFLGNHSLVVKNYLSGSNVRYGYCYLGSDNDHSYRPAFPFTDTFKYVQGYYKYLPEREDTARFYVRTYAEGSTRSSNNLYLAKADTWTFFSIPLTYNDSRVPDSASFVAYSAIPKDTLGNGTALYIDNLDFVMEPIPVTLSTRKVNQSVKTYPNPTKDFIFLPINHEFKYAVVTDMLGRSRTVDIDNHKLDLRDDLNGIYFITLHGDQIQSKTFKVLKK